jgi:hypothetical protein
VVDAALAGALAVIRDRLMTIPDRMSTLTAEQRQALRQELTDALEAWSKTETLRKKWPEATTSGQKALCSRLFLTRFLFQSREIHAEA